MYMVKIEKVSADYGRHEGYEVLFYNHKENAEAKATEARKNHMTVGTVEVTEVKTED